MRSTPSRISKSTMRHARISSRVEARRLKINLHLPRSAVSRRVAVAILLAALLGGGLVIARSLAFATGAQQPPALASVDAATLQREGITLGTPTGAAVASQASVEQQALQQFPGSSVNQTVLAEFSDMHHVPAIQTLAWVVSLSPPPGFHAPSNGGFRSGTQSISSASYLVLVFDAGTGAFVEGTTGS